jgi:DNA modification methylase
MTVKIINADVMEGLRQLPDESVHCCVTSPPYWGLRDYGVEGQIGLEATPSDFVSRLVDVFAEVRRVLRKDGTCWVNLGDSYAGSYGAQGKAINGSISDNQVLAHPHKASGTGSLKRFRSGNPDKNGGNSNRDGVGTVAGLKAKDLIGVPWRVAFALQADGWYLRSDIIWHKPNPMPESVTDRPTKAHEYVFLLSKSERYYYDHEAIKEAATYSGPNSPASIASPYGQEFARRAKEGKNETDHRGKAGFNARWDAAEANGEAPTSRNKRSVWSISTAPFAEAHFATFPPELPEICIKAGCPVGGTVLDPFSGAGTTAMVADRLQRNAIGIELNPEYAAMSQRRIDGDRGGLLDLMEAAE